MKNETLETIKSLRTVHWDFNEKQVLQTDVETIIEHSLHTANSDNLTDYSVVVVTDPSVLNTITGGESGGRAATCLIYAIDHTRIIISITSTGTRWIGISARGLLSGIPKMFTKIYAIA